MRWWTRQSGLRLNPSFVLPLGTKEKLYPKCRASETFPIVEERRRSMGRLDLGLLSLIFPPLNHLSKFLMLTHPFPLKSLRPRPLRLPCLGLPRVPMNLLENEGLAWERFEKAVTGENVAACYNMSLKEFKYSGVHDLFKVCNYFYLVLSQ